MPGGPLLLGIDVGTTGSKALLIDAAGDVVASATHEYPLFTPRPLWSEQNPEDWWQATIASVRDVLEAAAAAAAGTAAGSALKCSGGAPSDSARAIGARVAAVGLTGQMHGLTLLDGQGRVLRPAILWNDQRTRAQCDEITRRLGAERVLQLTGNPVLTGFTAPKLLWVQQHEPHDFARIAAVLLPKDYVRYRLTGERFSDVSDASGTSLLDVANRRWSVEMLEAVGVQRAWLPEVTESPEPSTRISQRWAQFTGLPAGTPVVAGAGDQAAQAVGTGIVAEGVVSATIGTSGVVFAASDSYRVEPAGRLHAFCHAVPGMWHLMGVMLSAGGSLRWYRDALGEPERSQAATAGRDAYDLLLEAAASVPAGCEGLIFLPYLTGERTPHNDPHARGAFVGLTLRHGKGHLTRAILEGVAFGLRDSLELMRGLGLEIEELRASGGGARSPLWGQILADVFGCAVKTVNVTEGAAYGAALLAGVGAGVFENVGAACRTAVRVTDEVRPGRDAEVYTAVYPRYRALYPALRPSFRGES